jgi:hypothetical protein
LQIVLNDLSYNFPAKDIKTAKEIMESFLRSYVLLKELLENESVLMNADYNYIQLADGYNIHDWRKDPGNDPDIKRMFFKLLGHAQIIDDDSFNQTQNSDFDSDFTVDSKSSISCLIAYEIGGVLLSFLSSPKWSESKIAGEYCCFVRDEFISEETEIFNVCDTNTFHIYERHYKTQPPHRRCPVNTGTELWENRETLFPNLLFCKRTEKQLKESQKYHLTQIYDRLKILQDYFANCSSGFDPDLIPIKTTPESEPTLNQFQSDHTFIGPENRVLLFSWHVRFTGGGYPGRIFFHPENEKKRGVIGHINGKLPTVSEK